MNSKIELETEVVEAIESGKKIDAIKKLRELRGLGLKESKELVDLYVAQNNLQASSSASSSSGLNALFAVAFIGLCFIVYKYAI